MFVARRGHCGSREACCHGAVSGAGSRRGRRRYRPRRLQRLSGCAAAKGAAATQTFSADACSGSNLNVPFLVGEQRRGASDRPANEERHPNE